MRVSLDLSRTFPMILDCTAAPALPPLTAWGQEMLWS